MNAGAAFDHPDSDLGCADSRHRRGVLPILAGERHDGGPYDVAGDSGDRGPVGSDRISGGFGRRDAGIQLLLSATDRHLRYRGPAELGGARRLSDHRRHRQPALHQGAPAYGGGRRPASRGREVVRAWPGHAVERQRSHQCPGRGEQHHANVRNSRRRSFQQGSKTNSFAPTSKPRRFPTNSSDGLPAAKNRSSIINGRSLLCPSVWEAKCWEVSDSSAAHYPPLRSTR